MPRWASRIALEVTGVRVERVQEISCVDAMHEGPPDRSGLNPQVWFVNIWNAINAARGYGWDVNPWVWCIEFRRVEE